MPESKTTAKPATKPAAKPVPEADENSLSDVDVAAVPAAAKPKNGDIKVKNVTDRNIHTSVGKIPAKSEGFCTQEDADSCEGLVVID